MNIVNQKKIDEEELISGIYYITDDDMKAWQGKPYIYGIDPGAISFTPDHIVSIPEKVTKCECGSEAVGSSAHSTWCPKYEL